MELSASEPASYIGHVRVGVHISQDTELSGYDARGTFREGFPPPQADLDATAFSLRHYGRQVPLRRFVRHEHQTCRRMRAPQPRERRQQHATISAVDTARYQHHPVSRPITQRLNPLQLRNALSNLIVSGVTGDHHGVA
jgi:hypothetical protein